MDPLMQQMMQRAMPSQAVGTWTGQQAPPPDRKPGWTFQPPAPKAPPQPMGPGPGAATPPATPPMPNMGIPHLPPAVQRQNTTQAMQEGYKNNWQPNPMLLKAMMSRG